jgi:hypothetical protein
MTVARQGHGIRIGAGIAIASIVIGRTASIAEPTT